MDLKIITIEEEAFYQLINKVAEQVKKQLEQQGAARWVDGSEAMAILKIKSPTTLQKLRDEGKIRFSQPEKKILLYDRDSIMNYIEKNAKATF